MLSIDFRLVVLVGIGVTWVERVFCSFFQLLESSFGSMAGSPNGLGESLLLFGVKACGWAGGGRGRMIDRAEIRITPSY